MEEKAGGWFGQRKDATGRAEGESLVWVRLEMPSHFLVKYTEGASGELE